MSLHLSHTTFDALDPCAQARWWSEVLGWPIDPETPDEPGTDECAVRGPDGVVVLFFAVPDAKRVKNRAHLDLRPGVGGSITDELERVVSLGGTVVDDRREAPEGWVVLADPEGNEFCILAPRTR